MYKKEDSARSILRMIRISPRKLNLVAGLIRRMKVSDAMLQLKFSKKRVAIDIKKCLQSAIANAENNHNLDIDSLVISEVTVGKGVVMKRMNPCAKGRAAKIKKFFSNLYITVSEIKQEN